MPWIAQPLMTTAPDGSPDHGGMNVSRDGLTRCNATDAVTSIAITGPAGGFTVPFPLGLGVYPEGDAGSFSASAPTGAAWLISTTTDSNQNCAVWQSSAPTTMLNLPPTSDDSWFYYGLAINETATLALGHCTGYCDLYWTPGGGTQEVTPMPGGSFFEFGMAALDGSIAYGYGDTATSGGDFCVWTLAGGAVDLPPLPSEYPIGWNWVGCARDGSVAFFEVADSSTAYFRTLHYTFGTAAWTDLGVLPGATQAFPVAVSDDGSTCVGYDDANNLWRWTATAGLTAIPLPYGASQPIPQGISADGTVVCGFFSDLADVTQIFIWSAARGMNSFPDPEGIGQLLVNMTGTSLLFTNAADHLPYSFTPGVDTVLQALQLPSGAFTSHTFYVLQEANLYQRCGSANGLLITGDVFAGYNPAGQVSWSYSVWSPELLLTATPSGGPEIFDANMSADASTVFGMEFGDSSGVGYYDPTLGVWIWTAATGQFDVLWPSGDAGGSVACCAADGSAITLYTENAEYDLSGLLWRTSAPTAFTQIPPLPGDFLSIAYVTNSGGSVVLGSGSAVGLRWTAAGGTQPIGPLPGGSYLNFGCASLDCSVSYWTGDDAASAVNLAVYSVAGGLVEIATPADRMINYLYGCAADGSVAWVAGYSDDYSQDLWSYTAATGLVSIIPLVAAASGIVTPSVSFGAISGDGLVQWGGYANSDYTDGGVFRQSLTDGLVTFSTVALGVSANANVAAVSQDGSVAVGSAVISEITGGAVCFVATSDGVTLVPIPYGLQINEQMAISADGNTAFFCFSYLALLAAGDPSSFLYSWTAATGLVPMPTSPAWEGGFPSPTYAANNYGYSTSLDSTRLLTMTLQANETVFAPQLLSQPFSTRLASLAETTAAAAIAATGTLSAPVAGRVGTLSVSTAPAALAAAATDAIAAALAASAAGTLVAAAAAAIAATLTKPTAATIAAAATAAESASLLLTTGAASFAASAASADIAAAGSLTGAPASLSATARVAIADQGVLAAAATLAAAAAAAIAANAPAGAAVPATMAAAASVLSFGYAPGLAPVPATLTAVARAGIAASLAGTTAGAAYAAAGASSILASAALTSSASLTGAGATPLSAALGGLSSASLAAAAATGTAGALSAIAAPVSAVMTDIEGIFGILAAQTAGATLTATVTPSFPAIIAGLNATAAAAGMHMHCVSHIEADL